MQKRVGSKYRKLSKGLCLEVLIFGGDYTGRKICVSKSVRLILGEISAPSREPIQTVSAVYFILGILITDLWSQCTSRYILTTIHLELPSEDSCILAFYILGFNLKPRLLL